MWKKFRSKSLSNSKAVNGGFNGRDMEVRTGVMENLFDSARIDSNSSYPSDWPVYVRGRAGEVPVSFNENVFPNRRPLPRSAKTYELEKFPKHLMLIFHYDHVPGYGKREGTMADVAALTKCFGELRFEVKTYQNYTSREVFDIMDEVCGSDLSDYGCFAVVFLTYGGNEGRLFTSDLCINENNIIKFMDESNSPSLITKPKLLIVEACRGFEVSASVATNGKIKKFTENLEEPHKLDVVADMLLLHSTYPGKVTIRSPKGSYFIQSLCHFINKSLPGEDVFSIFSKVIRDVSIVPKEMNEIYGKWRQVPTVITNLRRRLYLKAENDTMDEQSLENDQYFKHLLSNLSAFVELRSVEDHIASFGTIMLKIARAIDHDKDLKKRVQISADICDFLQTYDSGVSFTRDAFIDKSKKNET